MTSNDVSGIDVNIPAAREEQQLAPMVSARTWARRASPAPKRAVRRTPVSRRAMVGAGPGRGSRRALAADSSFAAAIPSASAGSP